MVIVPANTMVIARHYRPVQALYWVHATGGNNAGQGYGRTRTIVISPLDQASTRPSVVRYELAGS